MESGLEKNACQKANMKVIVLNPLMIPSNSTTSLGDLAKGTQANNVALGLQVFDTRSLTDHMVAV